MDNKLLSEKITAAYLGASFGDGWSLPLEFCSRDYIADNYPVIEKPLGYLMHNQPPLTFSDDSSLLFCTTESLIQGYDLEDMACRYVRWMRDCYWSARGEVFDIGATTAKALRKYAATQTKAELCGEDHPMSAGNAAVTRCLAIAFYTLGMAPDSVFCYVQQVSSITHRHPISVCTAFYYVVYTQNLLTMDKMEAYQATNEQVKSYLASTSIGQHGIATLHRVLGGKIQTLAEHEVLSSPYCVHTLESALWSLFQTSSYRATLDLVTSLGEDTDSNAYLACSMAALAHGITGVDEWLPQLARYDEVVDLAARFAVSLSHQK